MQIFNGMSSVQQSIQEVKWKQFYMILDEKKKNIPQVSTADNCIVSMIWETPSIKAQAAASTSVNRSSPFNQPTDT